VILDEIVAAKRIELARSQERLSEAELEARSLAINPRGGFRKALTPLDRGEDIRLIAEIKKASPSKGLIRPDFRPVEIARQYESAGAAAISVLTDSKFFQGSLDILRNVSQTTSLPCLRKDFVLERYQLLEAREAGAAAVLLIVAVLKDREIALLLKEARSLGLGVLLEVHSEAELARALATEAEIIGVNNRDLKNFQVRIETTFELRAKIPEDRLVVSESGITGREDVLRLQREGVDAILVGESLMRKTEPGEGVRELLGTC